MQNNQESVPKYFSPPPISNIYSEEENISGVNPNDQLILKTYNMKYVGCLNPAFTKTEQKFFSLHPKSTNISLSTALNTMKGLNSTNNNMYDILIYNSSLKIGYAGEIDTSLLKEDLNDFSDMKTPNSNHFSSVFLTNKDESQCTINDYKIYVKKNPEDLRKWSQLINDLLHQKINSVSNNKNSAATEHKKLLCYQKVNNSKTSSLSFSDCMNDQQEDQIQNEPYNQQDNQEQIKEKLNLYKTAEVSNLNAIHTLKQMDINENKLLEKNYQNISGINEKILTTTERINTLKSRYSFNTKVIKHLKTALLVIFILTVLAMGFYGIRDNYTTKTK